MQPWSARRPECSGTAAHAPAGVTTTGQRASSRHPSCPEKQDPITPHLLPSFCRHGRGQESNGFRGHLRRKYGRCQFIQQRQNNALNLSTGSLKILTQLL